MYVTHMLFLIEGSGVALDPNTAPLAPSSHPNLALVPPTGVYRIDLDGSAPVLEGLLSIPDDYPPVALLFRVQDHTMEQVFFIWQVGLFKAAKAIAFGHLNFDSRMIPGRIWSSCDMPATTFLCLLLW